ncbi:alanine dehydrogenase [Halovenus aranensis]|jgi:alanine dehydrogenase|uniref:Alanine dehydrogenase n=1 Tax=Halovenus aranensis TaxID=890420 RepID=A0A1G8U503_9EURY|nr:ornithine cyclodeaminase family protein [Halovenus aranensis]SDJ48120.1 alanine dehydrogenase [Halovenus aranensis]
MVLLLTEAEVEATLDVGSLVDVVDDALVKQEHGGVERPERPHFEVGAGLDSEPGTGIAMPAYIHGDEQYATKLVGVHEANADRGMPTIHAQIVLTSARTGVPVAFMGGTTITNARTGCIGALSVRELAPETATLGVIGAGAQARWQSRAIATVAPLGSVRIYSPSDSRKACAADLREEGLPAEAVDTPAAAVEGADTVVTATTATEPVFPASSLGQDALVVAVGAFTPEMQELDPAVLDRATEIAADVPEEVAETGDMLAAGVTASELVPLGELVAEGREDHSGVTVVASVGSATLDAAASTTVYEDARDAGRGTELSL